jgi:hypothetical protein
MAQHEPPKIDLSAGLVPKKKVAAPRINLSAGLVPKEKIVSLPTGLSPKAEAGAGPRQDDSVVSPPIPPVGEAEGLVSGLPAGARPAQPLTSGRYRTDESHLPEPSRPSKERKAQAPAAVTPPAAAQPLQPAAPRPVPAPQVYPEAMPVPDWERHESASEDPPQVPRQQVPVSEPEPMDAATRMSGLRNLIFSLGLKNMHQTAEAEKEEASFAVPEEPVRPRPQYPRPAAPIHHDSVWNEPHSASPDLVTAQPEFLPPKPVVENTGKDHHRSPNGTSRRDRRDTVDDVDILPSWRGQYKRG